MAERKTGKGQEGGNEEKSAMRYLLLFVAPWLAVRRWWNGRKPPKRYVPGMTLAPGESALIEAPLPPDVSALVSRLINEGKKITFEQGPMVQTGTEGVGKVTILADGKPAGEFDFAWSAETISSKDNP